MISKSNKPDAPNAVMTSLFQSEHHRRGIGDPGALVAATRVMTGSLQLKLAMSVTLLAFLACGCRQQTFVSGSMAPTIAAGENVTVDYSAYAVSSPKRWDVVAFEGE